MDLVYQWHRPTKLLLALGTYIWFDLDWKHESIIFAITNHAFPIVLLTSAQRNIKLEKNNSLHSYSRCFTRISFNLHKPFKELRLLFSFTNDEEKEAPESLGQSGLQTQTARLQILKTGHIASQAPLPLHGGVGRFMVLFIGGRLRAPLECNDYFPWQSFDAAYKRRTGSPSNR